MEGPIDRVPAQESALLHNYLAERDVACPQCDYNLRNLTGDVCPECGEKVALRVSLVEPRQAAPIAGLIALSAGAGLNFLLVIYWVFVIWRLRRMSGNRIDEFFFVNAGGTVVLGIAIAAWLKCWRRIRGLGTARRWLLVLAAALATVTDLVVFIKVIR